MKTTVLTAAVLSGLALASVTARADTLATAVAAARPMTPKQVYHLYSGKSWVWSEGAGYFAPNRQFLAWSGRGDKATTGEGRWIVTEGGQLCFIAVWRSRAGASQATTCFRHRQANGVIYQKKEPAGRWYVFKQHHPSAKDEYTKLRRGNLVSRHFDRVATALTPASR